MSATLLPPPRLDSILETSPIPQLRRLTLTVSDLEVVIHGRVGTYYLKQLAQEAVKPAVGRRRLVNRVEVCRG